MSPSIEAKLQALVERYEEIAALLSQSDIISDQNKFRELSREYAQLEPVIHTYEAWQQAKADTRSAREMLEENDAELRQMAIEELKASEEQTESLALELQRLMLPKDPRDENNVFVEIRAGAGGDEAAIFAGDLLRMYTRYVEKQRWQLELISESEGEHGGYKQVIARVIGHGAFSKFKFESGGHRVQRVPATESQGRVHTSSATVAILPEIPDAEEVDINPADLRIDTYRASGAGGQHVNKTDSAVRLTHLPTGIVVECQDERSQHKNRARAMSLLQSKLNNIERDKQEAEQSESRRLQVGSGDRSDRIRTYNFPQGRMTDHRVNLTLYKLEEIMAGGLDQVIEPLLTEHQADLLAELAQQH